MFCKFSCRPPGSCLPATVCSAFASKGMARWLTASWRWPGLSQDEVEAQAENRHCSTSSRSFWRP